VNTRNLIRKLLATAPVVFIAIQIVRCPALPFYYYHDYNVLKRAVLDEGCVIESEIANPDITLEEIDFDIRTPSGWTLGLFFPEDRDMDQLCERPKGVLLARSSDDAQVYSMSYLNDALKENGVKLASLGDILRHFDLIGPILQNNYESDAIPRTTAFPEFELRKYLRLSGPQRPLTTESSRAIATGSKPTGEGFEPDQYGLRLSRIEFDVITLNDDGSIKDRQTRRAMSYQEDLGSGMTLEMVQVPGGRFLMGTSFEEATLVQAAYVRYSGKDFADFWQEGPPREVSIQPFFIGAFEVTQAQWQAVSKLPKVNWDLPGDPSRTKGDDMPVTNISWQGAQEFCVRLSRATGRQYRLPSEAEWEYACRAGTTTAYHFGNAITTEFANYDGVYPYGSVWWGNSREAIVPVGMFGAPNAFGLYDMHGNVGEMCADPWHDNYKGAPCDGSVWLIGGDNYVHVVRGGDYLRDPAYLRAASRHKNYNPQSPSFHDDGFRVAFGPGPAYSASSVQGDHAH
jgi:formylglycine-generating enzyme required for sulfatase activity